MAIGVADGEQPFAQGVVRFEPAGVETIDGVTASRYRISGAVFGDATTDTVTGLGTLSISGTTTINTDTITSAGTQTYTGAVTLGADTTLTTTDSAVLFSSTVDSTGGARDLTVAAGTGNITLTGAVGAGSSLDVVALNSTGTTTLSAAFTAGSLTTNAGGTTAINGGAVTTTGAQTYNDAVSLLTQ